MAASDAREQLLDFLEERLFRPVLDRSPADYTSEGDRERLERVQRIVRDELNRYRGLQTVDEIVREYRTDVELEPADVHRDLHRLGLRALPDLRDAFETKARELGYGR